MTIVYVGIDLAKSVFALHGVDEGGKPALVRPSVARAKLLDLVAALPPCTIGMGACSGAHHWARLFVQHGHTVRLIAPKFVVPYRLSGKRGKNDAADAAAICEAVQRPQMRFVPVKSLEQQGVLCLHRVRQGFIEQRTACINRIRGLLSEFGIVLPQAATVRREALQHLVDEVRNRSQETHLIQIVDRLLCSGCGHRLCSIDSPLWRMMKTLTNVCLSTDVQMKYHLQAG
nr:IS110 family transposase [Hylemonella gracilis]